MTVRRTAEKTSPGSGPPWLSTWPIAEGTSSRIRRYVQLLLSVMLTAAVFLGTCHSEEISSEPFAIDAVKSEAAGQQPADAIDPTISVGIQAADDPFAHVAPPGMIR